MNSGFFIVGCTVLLLLSCSSEALEQGDASINGASIYASNFTGHLVRRSGVGCGKGIHVAFVLISDTDKQEYIFEPDTYRSVVININRGDQFTVQAYEIQGDQRLFLTHAKTIYDPPADNDREVFPEFVLCPKDQIKFYDLN